MLISGASPQLFMSFNRAVKTYVVATAIAAALVLFATHGLARPATNWWALGSFFLVGALLEFSRTQNKTGGLTGSLVFVFHLAAGLVLGGFWGALTAGLVKAISQLQERSPAVKFVFNVSERVISVGLAFIVYSSIGGKHPPDILLANGMNNVNVWPALQQVGMFLAAAVVYFVVNSGAVNAVVALASGRPILSTWRTNTVWVFGYDIAASSLALLVAKAFLVAIASPGLERLLPVVVVGFLAFIRHIYSKLNTVQNLFWELDSAYEQLELNVREQLAMMVKAIEARDPYTSGHSRRVCGLSRAIAIDLGLSPEQIEEIENAALLHDVGKIHAEFAPLLMKEGKLTDEEWKVMKTHSAKSAELVSLFSRFQGYVVACVRHHHERWDGRGYPDGVAGDAIPLGARIITIADTIDAMTTNRPYRNALPIEVVLSELNKGRSTQFDESLVELTVNSVTVRRLISDPSSIPEYLPSPKIRSRADAARLISNSSAKNEGKENRAAARF